MIVNLLLHQTAANATSLQILESHEVTIGARGIHVCCCGVTLRRLWVLAVMTHNLL